MNGMRGLAGGLEGGEPALGRLVGGAVVRAAGLARRAASVSIIIPCDGLTGAEPFQLGPRAARPALAWGSRPVSSSTAAAAATR